MDVAADLQAMPLEHKALYNERIKVGVGSRSFDDLKETYSPFLSLSLSQAHTEQLLLEMARNQSPPQELDVQNGAVHARTALRRGHRFGPYEMKYTTEPVEKAFAWEVS